MNPYSDLFKAMNEAGIRYLVVGGIAVNLHGYRRFTGDVDVLMALEPANLEKMAVLMQERGFIQRLPVSIQQLSDREQVQKWLEEKGMTAYTFIDSRDTASSIDILAGYSLDFDEYDEDKVVVEAWGIDIPIISIDDLIGMKQKANREKDIEDIAALLTLKGL
jgi:predicted nucleotidyltransferase